MFLASLLIAPALAGSARAASAPFDLSGPALHVAVTRGGTTLPIARVPNLAAGDRISIKADLPEDQGAHYVLIAAFLRGATNPPPKKWFFHAKTWETKHNDLSLTVPDGARQLVLFLMPEDNGDVDAVVDAVRKQPGTFVRASQELNQASLDRARLDTFLGAIHDLERRNPERIAAASPVLTRSLSIKLNADCLQQTPDLQAACLTQDRESLLLADSHSSALADTLTGAPIDLAFQVSATPNAGYGYYSPYIGVARDIARIFGAFQATQLRYIPALARTSDDEVRLLLNAAPSFGKPASVLVVALPAVEAPRTPPLRRADDGQALCATDGLVLPVDGAPLIYATRYAHDMVLRMSRPGGGVTELPVVADPQQGGYVLAKAPQLTGFDGTISARLHGDWGFAPFDGPAFALQNPRAPGWHIADSDPAQLVVGRDNPLTIAGPAPACVESVSLRAASGDALPVSWKPAGGGRITATLPLAKADPGTMSVLIRLKGVGDPVELPVAAYAEAGRIDGFTLHAGDAAGELTGSRLDKVAALKVGKLVFRPGPDSLSRVGDTDHLALAAQDPSAAAALPVGQPETAVVTLADGRTQKVAFTVASPRPAAKLIGLSVARPQAPAGTIAIRLDDPRAVPAGAHLTFSLAASGLTGKETVEIATADGRASATIDAAHGYTIQNDRVAIVTVDPASALGASAYGPLRFRLVQNGIAGAWTDLATLVRLPQLTGVACPKAGDRCTLSGSSLFLIAEVAGTPVADGFTGAAIEIPRPADGTLPLRLRDAPDVAAKIAVPKMAV
ncbi:MAG TPA: hypothetical protein VFT56_05530 [Sphingomonas sp.]|nr:hypothetical protein [Sphingomonas sp.]